MGMMMFQLMVLMAGGMVKADLWGTAETLVLAPPERVVPANFRRDTDEGVEPRVLPL